MQTRDAVIFWTPATMKSEKTAGKMTILRRKDAAAGYTEYFYSDLGDWGDSISASEAEISKWILGIAFRAMVRDGLAPETVWRALWKLEDLQPWIPVPMADVISLKKG